MHNIAYVLGMFLRFVDGGEAKMARHVKFHENVNAALGS